MAAPVAYNWSGFYVGAHGGGVWGDRRYSTQEALLAGGIWGAYGPFGANADIRGALAGGQIGINFQSGPWVFGAQFDAAWTNAESDTGIIAPLASPGCNERRAPPSFGVIFRCQTKQDWLASAIVRGGYAWDRLLLYAKGGVAWTKENYQFGRGESIAQALWPSFTADAVRAGWTVGGGLEYAFAQNWSVFGEYNFYDFGTRSQTLIGQGIAAGITTELDFRTRFSTAKVGINYKFNWGQSPVVARY
jgi:outer membrane immunogenic protein